MIYVILYFVIGFIASVICAMINETEEIVDYEERAGIYTACFFLWPFLLFFALVFRLPLLPELTALGILKLVDKIKELNRERK